MLRPDRRAVVVSAASAGLLIASLPGWATASAAAAARGPQSALACFTRYVVDPAKLGPFDAYCRRWLDIVPRCGGTVVGLFAPHEGSSNMALTVIALSSLADYERYEARIRADPAAVAAQRFAQEERFILSETRWFSRRV